MDENHLDAPLEDAQTDVEAAPIEAAATPALYSKRKFLGAITLVFFGVFMLIVVAVAEVFWVQKVPWAFAVMVVDGGAPPKGALRAKIRDIPALDDAYIQEMRVLFQDPEAVEEELGVIVREEMLDGEGGEKKSGAVVLEELPYTFSEHLIQVHLKPEDLQGLVGEGRAPKAGAAEIIAGELCGRQTVTLDGVEFKVVGSFKRGVSAMQTGYLLPKHKNWAKLFGKESSAHNAWIHSEGMTRLAELLDPETLPENAQIVMGNRSHPVFIFLSMLALVLIAIGGSVGHAHLFWRVAGKNLPLLGGLLTAITERPRLFYRCHYFFYGLFFFAMYQGLANPLWSTRLTELIGRLFLDGELSYIGDAYSSGNYLAAAAATWWNNYIVQTVFLTFAISVIPLGAGILKTAFSFIQVGFAMPPAQVGSAGGYSYHSITMILELEAYIVACFAVILWTTACYRALFYGDAINDLKGGAHALLGGLILSGVMLAVAGFYEAVTLITFSMF